MQTVSFSRDISESFNEHEKDTCANFLIAYGKLVAENYGTR